MKQRVISGVFIAIICIVAVLFGGVFLDGLLAFIGIYGSYEFVKIRKEKFDLLLFVLMASSLMGIFLFNEYALCIALFEILLLLGIAVFYEKENFDDVSSVAMMSLLLGYTLYFIRMFWHLNRFLLAYVLIVSFLTDIFAFQVGIKFGKHKLNPRISPKKTIEGSIGGWVFGCVISFAWAFLFHFFDMKPLLFILGSLFLPLVSEVGDLAFSLIKRHYGVKDFSNLIPGHGGILDRIDSHVFCVVLFGILMTIFA